MLKRIFIMIIIMSSELLSSQNLNPVEQLLVRTNMTTVRDTTFPLNNRVGTRNVVSCQLLFTFKVDNVSDSSNVVIEIGTAQNLSDVFTKQHKFVHHQNQLTQRCLHTDESPEIEIGPINDNYAEVEITLTPQQYASSNWTCVYVVKNQQQSQKKHFQIK
jgi:hypothetical protein